MYKVFVENRPVIFTQNSENDSHLLCVAADEVEDVIALVRNHTQLISNVKPMIILCRDVEVDFNRLFLHFEFVNAAGGLVIREDEILVIRKNGMWDLPKGIVDFGETTAQTAYREISEECGIEGHLLDRELMDTWHTYMFQDRWVLKHTTWFEFHYSGTKITHPQFDEGISEAVWMSKDRLNTQLDACYSSIRDVLDYFWHKI